LVGRIDRAIEAIPERGLQRHQRMLVWQKIEPPPPIPVDARPGFVLPLLPDGVYRDYAGATLTGYAFDRDFPGLGKYLVTLAAWLFALSTMISWSYYGEQAVIYMAGKRWVLLYKILFLGLAIVGAVLVKTNKELGDLADFGTGWMLWANMLIVLSMGYLAVNKLRDYFERLKSGSFHPHYAPPMAEVIDGKDVEE